MTWVIDTCVLIDIITGDSDFMESSIRTLDSKLDCPLVISPITYIEMAPCFGGNVNEQNAFLNSHWITFDLNADNDYVLAAHQAWYAHIQRKRMSGERKRPMADVLIGAYAKSLGAGLITRNEADFKTLYPDLTICNPATEGLI